MKIYNTILASNSPFALENDEYEEFYFNFTNSKERQIIKFENHFLEISKSKNSNCEDCFFFKKNCHGGCGVADLLQTQERWQDYVLKELDEFEVVFG